MKIAVVTLDGETVSQHFGRSPYYKIVSVENKKVIKTEMRLRGTGHFAPSRKSEEKSENHHPEGKHGYGADADRKHASMAMEIADCDVLIAGGMGQGAYESFKKSGLSVYLTNHSDIHAAVDKLINGTLINLYETRTD